MTPYVATELQLFVAALILWFVICFSLCLILLLELRFRDQLMEGKLMPFLNECEECGADYQASPKGRETWFTLCAACLLKESEATDD
jgi:hypothetical protein